MKRSLLVSAMLCCLLAAKAQNSPVPAPLQIDPVKDRMEINGFTIMLVPAPRNSYLFQIQKASKMVYHHPMHPVTLLPDGFLYKEDAFKVAEWMIREFGKQEHFPPLAPPHIIRELKLKQDPFSPTPKN